MASSGIQMDPTVRYEGNPALARSDAAAMARSVGRFLRTPLVVAAKSEKRLAILLRMEAHILQEALPQWLVQVESGAVRRPSLTGSKRHWERECRPFKQALRDFRAEHNTP